MKEVITIQIPRPMFDEMSATERAKIVEYIGKQVAEQIVFQEELRKKHENLMYWQHKLIDWQIEDKINEIKYGQLGSSQ